MITSIVSHGQGALETGPVCYGGAEDGTASKAWVYSKHRGRQVASDPGTPGSESPDRLRSSRAGPKAGIDQPQ